MTETWTYPTNTAPYEAGLPTDDGSRAGAHVIRMIARSLGAADPPTGTLPDVEAIYTDAHTANTPPPAEPAMLWWIDPSAMLKTLPKYDPRTITEGSQWVLYDGLPNQVAADNQIADTLANYNVPAAVLVQGGVHWVCVNGYGIDPNAHTLVGFYVQDPDFYGGGANVKYYLSGPTGWDAWFTPVIAGNLWHKKWIEVGDPKPAKEVIARQPRPIRLPGDRIITPDEAARFAQEGIANTKGESGAFGILARGKPLEPRLVSRLDREDTFYYIVPFQAGNVSTKDQVNGAVIVDARFGDVMTIAANEEPFSLLGVSAEDARHRVTTGRIALEEPLERAVARLISELGHVESEPKVETLRLAGSNHDVIARALATSRTHIEHLKVRSESLAIHPILGWMPCFGTPFYPMHLAISPNHTFYVSTYDGYIKTNLDFCDWLRLGA